jgi:UDP-N-acetylmuramate dehydrogenase
MALLHIKEQVSLSAYTTIGLGGPARYFVDCTSDDDIRAAITVAREKHLPLLILGGGSNMIVSDEGFPGLVLHVSSCGIDTIPHGYRCMVRVAAGERWDDVVATCVQRGLGGLECLSGIPGTAGATPVQNVGAYGQEVSDTIASVHAIDRHTLERVAFAGKECGFRYRRSRFKDHDADRFIITGVEFDLPVTSHAVIRYPELAREIERDTARIADGHQTIPLAKARETVLRLRKAKGMVTDPADPDSRSAGSFFTNPILSSEAFTSLQSRWMASGGTSPIPSFSVDEGVKIPAAWLVEHAGFPRGTHRGGAGVSKKHALALVNRGGTARDLLALAEEIRSKVKSTFDVTLEFEPVVVFTRSQG